MTQAYSREKDRLDVLGIGACGYLMAATLVLAGSGGLFWFGVAWLACGGACTATMLILHNRIFGRSTAIKEWFAFPGWGGFLLLGLAIWLGTDS